MGSRQQPHRSLEYPCATTQRGQLVEYDSKYVDDIREQAREYLKYVKARDRGHYQMTLRLQRRERLLGIPVIILSTIVGTAIFATLQAQTATGWKIATGLLSVLAATLAALQTFFNFGSEAEKHGVVANHYARMRRDFEEFDLKHRSGYSTRDEVLQDLSDLLKQLEEIEKDSPRIPNSVWEEAYGTVSGTAERRG
jgi:hypothetical protein